MSTFNEATLEVANTLRKDAPVIGIIFGIGTLIGSGVVAAMSARKSDKVLTAHKYEIKDIKEARKAGSIDEKTEKKEITRQYGRTAWELFKQFAPAIGMAVAGSALIWLAYKCEHTRYLEEHDKFMAASAALASTIADFNGYRERTRARFGEEVDNELLYDIQTEVVEEEVTDSKGKTKTVKKTVQNLDNAGLPGYGVYAKWFKKGCDPWENNAEMNKYTLQCIEERANEILKRDGKLSVNDIYEMCGIKDEFDQPLKTKAGQVMGWIYNPEGSDHQIDLGIFEPVNKRFVNKEVTDCLINPMPEDNIWELLEE